jgi:protein required for attachment to host cells
MAAIRLPGVCGFYSDRDAGGLISITAAREPLAIIGDKERRPMILDGRTLILVADGGRARVFEEPRRGGPLHERPEWLAGLSVPHAAVAGPQGGGHDRMGHASHATAGQTGRDKAEAGFMVLLSRRLQTLFREQDFDQLILIAAPKALGMLRRHLPASVKTKLAVSEPHDRLAASADTIHEVVRRLRRLSA